MWREATTIHGGSGPVGLALALKGRGFAALVVVSHDGLLLKSRASARRRDGGYADSPGARSGRSDSLSGDDRGRPRSRILQ
ncbi:peptidase C39 family protein [Bradyrhizobium sp. 179]|nr:peptidase C39 family protein [Bradyrhizobium sp. 179]